MSTITSPNFAPYSRDGLNLKSALSANTLHRTRQQGSLVGKGFDLLHQSLMEKEDKKVHVETTIKSPLEDRTRPVMGIQEQDRGAQKTILGSTLGTIISKLI